MRGEGRVMRHFEIQQPNFQSHHFGPTDWFTISHQCGGTSTSNGLLLVINRTNQTIPMFANDGGASPTYTEMGPDPDPSWIYFAPTAAAGELYTFTVHHPDGRVATAFVSTVRRASDCVFQVQIMVANTEAPDM